MIWMIRITTYNLAGFGSQLQILTANVHSETKTVLTNFPLDTTNDLLGNGLSNGFSPTQLLFLQTKLFFISANNYVEFLLIGSPVEGVKPINTLTIPNKLNKFPLDSKVIDDQNGLTEFRFSVNIKLFFNYWSDKPHVTIFPLRLTRYFCMKKATLVTILGHFLENQIHITNTAEDYIYQQLDNQKSFQQLRESLPYQ